MPAQNSYGMPPKWLRQAQNSYGKPPNRHANSPKWLRQAAQMATASPNGYDKPQMARFINVTSLAMANFKRRQALVFAHDSSHANPLRFGSEPFDALFDRNVDRIDIGQF